MRPFHLQLESSAAATFPLLRRFGLVTFDLYPAGFRMKSLWLRAFSLNGSRTITIEDPLSRTYVERPMSDVGAIARSLGARRLSDSTPRRVEVASGTVSGLPSRRYRLIYDTNRFIDLWTTEIFAATSQFRKFADEIMRVISQPSAAVVRRIPGTPLYVELNIDRYRKLPLLRTKHYVFNRIGELEALRVSPFMFPAPFGTIFK